MWCCFSFCYLISFPGTCHRKPLTSSQHCSTAPQPEATTVSSIIPILSLSHLCDSESERAPHNHNTTITQPPNHWGDYGLVVDRWNLKPDPSPADAWALSSTSALFQTLLVDRTPERQEDMMSLVKNSFQSCLLLLYCLAYMCFCVCGGVYACVYTCVWRCVCLCLHIWKSDINFYWFSPSVLRQCLSQNLKFTDLASKPPQP